MTAVTTPAQVRKVLGDTGGGTSAARGEEIHRFVREHGFERSLELGFAHGAGSVWIASALEANGRGSLTSLDIPTALARVPTAHETVERAGLSHRVDLIVEETSYNWYLHRLLRERTADGRTEPLFDFVFLDGGHLWEIDGLAFFLVDRLLRPGGWLLLDDLDWSLGDEATDVPEAERRLAQMGEVWELLVCAHPSYDELRSDGQWGWARKSATEAPAERVIVRRDVAGSVREIARMVRSKARARLDR